MKKVSRKRSGTLGLAGDKVARGVWPFLNDFSTERLAVRRGGHWSILFHGVKQGFTFTSVFYLNGSQRLQLLYYFLKVSIIPSLSFNPLILLFPQHLWRPYCAPATILNAVLYMHER